MTTKKRLNNKRFLLEVGMVYLHKVLILIVYAENKSELNFKECKKQRQLQNTACMLEHGTELFHKCVTL